MSAVRAGRYPSSRGISPETGRAESSRAVSRASSLRRIPSAQNTGTPSTRERARSSSLPPRRKTRAFGERDHRAPPPAQRKKEREHALERRAFRNKKDGSGRIVEQRGARQTFLHAPALRRIDTGQIDVSSGTVAERAHFFKRADRHTVPIPHFRMRARECIEEGALPGIRVPDQINFHVSTPILRATSAPSAVVALAVRT